MDILAIRPGLNKPMEILHFIKKKRKVFHHLSLMQKSIEPAGAYPENFEGGPLSDFSTFFFEIFDKT